MSTPIDHTYTVTLTFRSPRPYTKRELEHLAAWWVFIADRQVRVTAIEVKKGEKA